MLKKLVVKNYVLIDQLDLSFSDGMSIITGETGAGKSIILGALGLILGQRADVASLLKKDKKCIIEGTFDISAYKLKTFFDEAELDYDQLTTLRREISIEGKSRAFINDTPVNLATLKALTSQLVDIHSQHETLLLNNSKFQLEVVDAYAGNEKKLNSYKQALNQFKSVQLRLDELIEAEAKGKSDFDYFNFQFSELDEANLSDPNEQITLEKEQELLNHAEEIGSYLAKSIGALSGPDESLIANLNLVLQSVSFLNKYDDRFEELSKRLKSSIVELKDINDDLERESQEINVDPVRLEQVQDRLSLIYKLQQKHRVDSIEALIEIRDQLSEKLANIGNLEDEIKALQSKLITLKNDVVAQGNDLTKSRQKAIPAIETEIKKQLSDLSMAHAVLKIEVIPAAVDQFYSDGLERVQFLFSANKGIDFREISKVASGGEMSRLMLCIKAIMAKLASMPTVIFDEIDTGISGETASKVGAILQQMSKHHQVMAITHLPQMAAKGNNHYFVFKEEVNGTTRTQLRLLNEQERINEIARMLSGEKLTEAAIGNAKSLLASA
jgi:DNA repair protein RecN (Recombination protein N)